VRRQAAREASAFVDHAAITRHSRVAGLSAVKARAPASGLWLLSLGDPLASELASEGQRPGTTGSLDTAASE
jgi:hypothetical protein